MYRELIDLFLNRNFKNLLVIFAFMDGSYMSLGTIMDLIFEPNGYTSTDTSILGGIFVVCGLISSIIFPIVIEKHHWFLKSLKMICYGALLSSLLVAIAIPSRIFWFAIISIGLLGFFVIPTMSIVYALATEVTYPSSEALFGSLLQAASGIVGTIISYVIAFVIRMFGTIYALILYSILFLVCCLLTFFITEDLRRMSPMEEEVNGNMDDTDNESRSQVQQDQLAFKSTSKINHNNQFNPPSNTN